ncbi:MAG: hypothetical protein ACP5N1_00165 [Candidatus Woesearchaeota archaeon]
MKRKVVKQGAATLMISLPSEWTHQFKISKGDELEMEMRGRTIQISTQKENFDKETELNIDGLYPVTLLTASAIYKAGYDNLKITFSDPKRISDINNFMRDEITGFEIIEQGKNYCTVKKTEEGLQDSFELILRRIFLLLINMAEDSYEAIKKGDYADLERLKFLDQSNNRLTTYCRRFLSKKGYKVHDKIQFIYLIIEQLEKISDQYVALFEYLIKNTKQNTPPSKEILTIYNEIYKSLRNFYEIFYKFDKEKMVNIGQTQNKLNEKLNMLLEKKGSDAVVIHYLTNIHQLIYDSISPYASMIL